MSKFNEEINIKDLNWQDRVYLKKLEIGSYDEVYYNEYIASVANAEQPLTFYDVTYLPNGVPAFKVKENPFTYLVSWIERVVSYG